jgi:hypothetical protein
MMRPSSRRTTPRYARGLESRKQMETRLGLRGSLPWMQQAPPSWPRWLDLGMTSFGVEALNCVTFFTLERVGLWLLPEALLWPLGPAYLAAGLVHCLQFPAQRVREGLRGGGARAALDVAWHTGAAFAMSLHWRLCNELLEALVGGVSGDVWANVAMALVALVLMVVAGLSSSWGGAGGVAFDGDADLTYELRTSFLLTHSSSGVGASEGASKDRKIELHGRAAKRRTTTKTKKKM